MTNSADKPINSFVDEQVRSGAWREETLQPDMTGLPRPMKVYRAPRKQKRIKHDWHGGPSSARTFCPPRWYDVAVGSGACGLGCRFCFLMLTFRKMRDPMSPVLYDNYDEYERDMRSWLLADTWKTDMSVSVRGEAGAPEELVPVRRVRRTALDAVGLGIDNSDSLLFEGVTGHARRFIPLFASPETNPRGNLLVLLTKSANVHYLEGLPTANVAVTFSMNPEREADLWEGKYPDTLERITPPVRKRLEACLAAQRMGFEVRWRLDPILTPPGWEADYRDFFREAASMGIRPHATTLGTFRQKNEQLDLWRSAWGLVAPEWEPDGLERDGTHMHLGVERRADIYRTIMRLLDEAPWPAAPRVELCKETHEMRRAVGIKNCSCNCLKLKPGA